MAASQPAIVLDQAPDGRKFGGHQALFHDVSGRYTIDQVSRGAEGVTFTPTASDAPAFGFSRASAWLRFTVENRSSAAREWLFRERDLAYRNVVFRLRQPPGMATYYLRAQTTGSLTLPLASR